MAATVLPSAAVGAEIAPTDQLDCGLILPGEIRKGDFEKFAAAAQECGVTIRSSGSPDWPSGTIAQFMWPSGAKTVVLRSGSRVEVNGARTYPREDPQHGTCFRNGASGNDFCVRQATR